MKSLENSHVPLSVIPVGGRTRTAKDVIQCALTENIYFAADIECSKGNFDNVIEILRKSKQFMVLPKITAIFE